MKFNIYLIKERISEFSDAISPSYLQGEDEYITADLQGLPFDAVAYIQRNKTSIPNWVSTFHGHIDDSILEGITNTSSSIMLMLRSNQRIFVVTYGYAYLALKKDVIVTDFGLKVVLNSVESDSLKAVEARGMDAVARQRKTVVAALSNIDNMGLEHDEEMVLMAGGVPQDDDLAKAIFGSDSLKISVNCELSDLSDKCAQLLTLYRANHYQNHFGFIDNIASERDIDTINALKSELRTTLNSNPIGREVNFAPFKIDEWDSAEKFRLVYNRKRMDFDQLDIGEVERFLSIKNITNFSPEDIKVRVLDRDNKSVAPDRSLYEYLVSEVSYDGKLYVVCLGKWFKISEGFKRDIESRFSQLIPPPNNFSLPNILPNEHEGTYNERVANSSDDYVCLDTVNYHPGGRSSVEPCDILTRDLNFVCVKPGNKSATLSHLFSQGKVSAALLRDLQEYREFIVDNIPDDWGIQEADFSNPENISFTFAIASRREGNMSDYLPFFSKLNAVLTHKEISRMGYQVFIYKIEQ